MRFFRNFLSGHWVLDLYALECGAFFAVLFEGGLRQGALTPVSAFLILFGVSVFMVLMGGFMLMGHGMIKASLWIGVGLAATIVWWRPSFAAMIALLYILPLAAICLRTREVGESEDAAINAIVADVNRAQGELDRKRNATLQDDVTRQQNQTEPDKESGRDT